LLIVFRYYGLQENEGITFHTFHWWLWFSKIRQDRKESMVTRALSLNKLLMKLVVMQDSNYKLIRTPSLKLAKLVNEEQH
jgi:hypothetical protein